MPSNDENNLISIDDAIFRAKRLDVDFGKGDPRERLRYLTKIGLLPHAKRKSFNGNPPNGAYPEYVIELLVEIDRKIKAGKSIQELKKEKERKTLTETFQPKIKIPQIGWEIKKAPQVIIVRPKYFEKIGGLLKIIFLFLIFGGIVFFLTGQVVKESFYSYFLASFSWLQRFAQAPPAPVEGIPEREEILLPSIVEPYLTINAETDINAPLNVKEQITTPYLSLLRDEFRATLSSADDISADRTYIFPNLSGTVCLTTGNCVGMGGEVLSPGGIANRLAKFITSQEIGVSSIEDLYPGVALTIDSEGKVGIGTRNPAYALHVEGRIQASGDICTDLAGGRCLSTLLVGGVTGARGIGGSGTANYLPIWTGRTTLGNSIISQAGSIINIDGTIRVLGFQFPTGAQENYVLTSIDETGTAIWQALPAGVLPPGEFGQTLRYDGENWVADSFFYNTGTALGIGTTSTLATLTLSGNAIFSTTTSPQLVLRYDDLNYLKFAINGDESLIDASNRLVLNSSGEIKLGDDVTFFDALGAIVRGATFVSAAEDSTVRKSGELVFRASIPIFRFPIAAQTTSTDYVAVSKEFSSSDYLNLITPPQLPGTDRVYAFLINFADSIATTSSSTWRVFRPTASTTYSTFSFSGQELSNLEVGNPRLTATTTLPDNDWRLDVSIPFADKTIRIFNIFLLVFDQIQ